MIILVSLLSVIVVTILFLIISYKKLLDTETFSSYECGFNIKSLARIFFSFRFFKTSILFLIFHVEIDLVLPIPYLSIHYITLNITFIFYNYD
ncbi:unnamed protein product [Larinioides sclopetarius]|uniref:NADH-ubiquinone oxidoreductase chain 3 n=1 Tax=Larinioides sclopetarius TaxID=280406 RepID=A0AAV2ASQ1_9ARAC